jgi:hypothetical protein
MAPVTPSAPGWIDTANREAVRVSYNNTYAPSTSAPMGWVGDIAAGNAGSTTQAFKDAVALRINWYRSMAGVPPTVVLDPAKNVPDQQAALMMSANNQLNHMPPSNWIDWTAAGANAASHSNLCLGFSHDPGCLDAYMQDFAANNSEVGHRRWVFYPQTQLMGTGDVPGDSGHLPANALWVIDEAHFGDARPATRDGFVAWPPRGYVPYQLVWARWSFSYPGADFTHATVSMSRNGVAVPTRLETVQNGFGENTLAWVTDNLDANVAFHAAPPVADTDNTVTLGNVVVDGVARSFTYDVIVFDPARAGVSTNSQHRKLGIYRNGFWFVDLNGNNQWDGAAADNIYNFGVVGDIPVVGDWDGTGAIRIGVYRGGLWFVDLNGNHQWDGASADRIFNFGVPGDVPVVGDWDGTGKLRIGVYRDGFWYLDMNGNNQWDGPGVDRIIHFGLAGDVPVVGDWDGTGKLRIGVYRNGSWFVDLNGNFQWDGIGVDAIFNFGVGGDRPVVADWDNAQLKLGIYRNGSWFVDFNGNFQWDGAADRILSFGVPGDIPITGPWN